MFGYHYESNIEEKQRKAAVEAALQIVKAAVAAGNGLSADKLSAEDHISRLADAIKAALKA